MRIDRISRVIRATPSLGIALFAFSAGFPPLDDATAVDLTLHMLQHVLIIFSGALIAYPLFRNRLARDERPAIVPKVGLLVASALIVFWHLPVAWDAAVLNPGIHLLEHISFLAVGALAGSWLLMLSDSAKIGALTAALFGHMGYAVALISPWHVQVYSLYSVADQALLGWVLILTGPSLVVGIAYVIARNPEWVAAFRGSGKEGPRKETPLNRVRAPSWLAPALTLIMLTMLVGYYATAAIAVGASKPVGDDGAIVYIEETPISWQYSPQVATVVLGVNSTVTWVSHSISYDTVTDMGGAFESGPIAPGQTYSFTFTTPGVYVYGCLYHPWMTGTVRVVSAGS
jgi:plastocyanin